MLKKLAKYGNSTTLVIDKAILELLNMDESSIVKLRTDGKSLIITPVTEAEKSCTIATGMEEARGSAFSKIRPLFVKELEKKTASLSEKEVQAGTLLMPELQQDMNALFAHHKAALDEFEKNWSSNLEFAEALTSLEQKYNPKTQSEDYMKEFMKLRPQFFPELAQFDKDMTAISEKYNNLIKASALSGEALKA